MTFAPEVKERLKHFVEREQLTFTETWPTFVDMLIEVRRDNRALFDQEYAAYLDLFDDLQPVTGYFLEELTLLEILKKQRLECEAKHPERSNLGLKCRIRGLIDVVTDEFLHAVLG